VISALVGRAAAKNFPADSLERQPFSGNLDRGDHPAWKHPITEEHNTWEIFAKKLAAGE
jgi:hypothetical protein